MQHYDAWIDPETHHVQQTIYLAARNDKPTDKTDKAEDHGSREPITDLFTQSEISRLLGVSTTRLRTLDRSGIVSPSGKRRGRRAYSFADLIQLRAAQSLLQSKVRLRDVSRAMSMRCSRWSR